MTPTPNAVARLQGGIAGCVGGAMREAARRITWRVAFFIVAIAFAFNLVLFVELLPNRDPVPEEFYVSALVIQLIAVFCITFATFIADEWVARGMSRLPAYSTAVVIGSAAAAFLQWHVRAWLQLRVITSMPNVPRDVTITQPLFLFADLCIWGGIIVFMYVNRRTANAASARMHAAQVERARTQRRTLESRLQALQARIEPQFLFNTLAQVRELYAGDAAMGGRMLDDLIAYLRAALPHLRESTSTLGREIDLARAYLDIMQVRMGARLAVDIDVPSSARDARMPPMMLLPLIDHALVYGLAPPTSTGSIRIGTRMEAERLRLTITDSGGGFVVGGKADDLKSIAERLHALYGDAAELKFEQLSGHGTQAVMEIPYEATGSREMPS